jgi:hypothetical protein
MFEPELGRTYRVVAADGKAPPQVVVFKLVSIDGGRLEVEVSGQTQTVGSFADLVYPWSVASFELMPQDP